MAQGKIAQVFDEGEKRKALRLLIKKYSKGFEDIGEKYIDSSIERTAVLRLDIEFISAKTKGENKSLPSQKLAEIKKSQRHDVEIPVKKHTRPLVKWKL